MAREENEEKCGFWTSFPGLKNIKSYKWVSIALVLVFLVVGGFVTLVSMKSAADKLAGGGNYNQLSANSAVYGGGSAAKAEKEAGFFASDEELAKADPALKKELLGNSGGAAGQSALADAVLPALPASGQAGRAGGAGGAEGGNFYSGPGGSGARSPASGSGPADKFIVREINPGRLTGGQTSRTTTLRADMANSNVSVRPAQSKSGAPGGDAAKRPKTSVMDALKSAFKVNLYGARLVSKDAARVWISKAFDGTPDAAYSLEYPEKMKAQLDRINPDSIPNFLREQNINATDAKSLGVSDVSKPEMDKNDGKDLANALFTPMGPFNRSGSPGEAPATDRGGPPASDGSGINGFTDPDGAQTLQNTGLEDFVATEGYGAECGCTAQAPCSCLPPDYFSGMAGDFPVNNI